MRILLAGSLDAGDAIYREIDRYRDAGHDVLVNTFHFDNQRVAELVQRYHGDAQVAFCTFSPSSSESLLAEITRGNIGFDAIIYPPDLEGLTHDVVAAATNSSLVHSLKVVGCPNDVIRHLSAVEKQGIQIENSSDLHAGAVAEYTLSQIGFQRARSGSFMRRRESGERGRMTGRLPRRQASPAGRWA